jgi:hypothetical protein
MKPLFIIGVYGYGILLADVISETLQRMFPLIIASYIQYAPIFNIVIFIIITSLICAGFFLVWGIGAIEELLVAFAAIVIVWLWHKVRGEK